MRRLALRLTVVGVSTAIALLLAEAVARQTYGEGFNMLVDPYEEHIYRPFLEYEQISGDRKVRFYTNSLGWKDERPGRVVEKRPRGARVVFLGDSFTEGLGVAQKDTITGVVQRALDPGGPGRQRIEVLNGGRSSFSPLLEYQRLKKLLGAGYEADMVVLLYDISDVQDELYYRGRYMFAPDGEPLRVKGGKNNPVLRVIYNESALVRSLSRMPEQLRALRGGGGGGIRPGAQVAKEPATVPAGYFQDAQPITAEQLAGFNSAAFGTLRPNWMAHPPSLQGWAGEGLRSSFDNILRTKRLAESRGLRFLLVIYPWPQLLYTREDPEYYQVLAETFGLWFEQREAIYGRRPAPVVSEYQRRMHQFSRENGIPLLDLIPVFQAVPEWHRLFLPEDAHFNEAGSRLAGLHIAEAIRRAGIGGKP